MIDASFVHWLYPMINEQPPPSGFYRRTSATDIARFKSMLAFKYDIFRKRSKILLPIFFAFYLFKIFKIYYLNIRQYTMHKRIVAVNFFRKEKSILILIIRFKKVVFIF